MQVFLPFLLLPIPSSLCSAVTVRERERDMEQQAKEELEILESLYPDRFEYLKLELKSFISQQQQHQHHHHLSEPSSFLSCIADTQESSNSNQRKRKKKKSTADEDSEYCDKHDECHRSVKKKKDRVDLVLERAEACLRKIRQFKASLLCDS